MTGAFTNRGRLGLEVRINFRIIVFVAVVLFLIGTPVFIFLKETISGGIETVGDCKDVDLKAMGNFPFDEINGTVNDIPPRYRALDGQTVQLEGRVFAPDEATDVMARFQLVYSIAQCCFQGPPKVQERVYIEVPPTMTVPNLNSKFARVRGRLQIELHRQEGRTTQVYFMEADEVSPL